MIIRNPVENQWLEDTADIPHFYMKKPSSLPVKQTATQHYRQGWDEGTFSSGPQSPAGTAPRGKDWIGTLNSHAILTSWTGGKTPAAPLIIAVLRQVQGCSIIGLTWTGQLPSGAEAEPDHVLTQAGQDGSLNESTEQAFTGSAILKHHALSCHREPRIKNWPNWLMHFYHECTWLNYLDQTLCWHPYSHKLQFHQGHRQFISQRCA